MDKKNIVLDKTYAFSLRILKDSDYLEDQLFNSLITDCDEVLKILFSIIRSSRTNL